MHRLATIPGGWNPSADGVIFVEQDPAPIVIITAADTDIQTLATAVTRLPDGFPAVRVVNLLQLQQQLTIDTYVEEVISQARVVLVRLIGGRAYWAYGLERVEETVQHTGATLMVLPGDDRPDPNLMSHSTAPLAEVNRVWRYCLEGGIDNYRNLLTSLATRYLGATYDSLPPLPVPRIGQYHPELAGGEDTANLPATATQADAPHRPAVGILFYRAHYLAGNTAVIDGLCAALTQRGLAPVPIFVSSLKDPAVQQELLTYPPFDVLLNTTSFALASLDADAPHVDLWETLNVPVFQVICSGGTQEQWAASTQGLTPRDMAMNVALPEVDGRIITRAVSFKAVQTQNEHLQTDVVVYEPMGDRLQFVADLAANWVALRRTPPSQRRVALVLANYPNRDGRLANGVGLDTPQSCIALLMALQQAGYAVPEIPSTDLALMQRLTAGITNDPESAIRPAHQTLSAGDYHDFWQQLPAAVRQGIEARWGNPPAHAFSIPGIQLEHVFVGIQPARGYDRDPTLNYHAPDLAPTHDYLAFYCWVRRQFGAQAVVHVGKHGNLEWLPGKSVALSDTCYPEVALGPLPHFYPFIVNDPGEGAQAKRRAQAVILDHLTPPMTRAELYGNLHQLEGLIDEYYEAQTLDPVRLPAVTERLSALISQESLLHDLGLTDLLPDGESLSQVLQQADGYLCELKEAQIRDGLHILGRCPAGRQLRDLLVAIARNPSPQRLGLTRAIAQDWQLDLDPLTAELGAAFDPAAYPHLHGWLQPCRIMGDVIEVLEHYAAALMEHVMQPSNPVADGPEIGPATQQELVWVGDRLLPALRQTDQELANLLHGLNGGYVPSGASGAPTRGRPDVLPTGRNFYSVDIRAIPTEVAWDLGRKAAEVLVERYTQEQGEYPTTLGLSVWGTSMMRTGGDDIAEALALLGVRPVWDGVSRRVVDFEILPLSIVGRPRVDVTLRISGFFRDAFPNLIDLFDSAVAAVAALDEPPEQNPLASRAAQEQAQWQAQGLAMEDAARRSLYRIFGSKPGAYGAGLQGLIESQQWDTEADLAQAYINWSAYAYGRNAEGQPAPEAFDQRLAHMQIVLQNQDNREHDLLDSDDYYQFQGGMAAAVKASAGQAPQLYFGDNAQTAQPKVRSLQDELARVYRSRVVNPKWIAGAMRHGYKGAFEMAATLDFLFAYDATTHCVADFMYEGVTQAYLLDPTVQAFLQQANPWALRDMAERLLEAHQRGLWATAPAALLNQLQDLFLEADHTIEQRPIAVAEP